MRGHLSIQGGQKVNMGLREDGSWRMGADRLSPLPSFSPAFPPTAFSGLPGAEDHPA